MKELSIEQKAEAYDKAIAYAQYLINERCKEGTNGSFYRADLQKMFPNIEESEDKRMIKFIKNQLFNIKKTITENYELDAKLTKAIDWLEKQGEQKPTWNEEDDRMLNEIIASVNSFDATSGTITMNFGKHEAKINWLKTIKYKALAQPSDEWSEEDESLYMQIEGVLSVCRTKNIISFDLYKKMYDLLKFLKDRIQLQPKWKPSDTNTTSGTSNWPNYLKG